MKCKILALSLAITSGSAHAGFFDDLKNGIDKATETVNKIDDAINNPANSLPDNDYTKIIKDSQNLLSKDMVIKKQFTNKDMAIRRARDLGLNLSASAPIYIQSMQKHDISDTPCQEFVSDKNHSQSVVDNFYRTYRDYEGYQKPFKITNVRPISTRRICLFSDFSSLEAQQSNAFNNFQTETFKPQSFGSVTLSVTGGPGTRLHIADYHSNSVLKNYCTSIRVNKHSGNFQDFKMNSDRTRAQKVTFKNLEMPSANYCYAEDMIWQK